MPDGAESAPAFSGLEAALCPFEAGSVISGLVCMSSSPCIDRHWSRGRARTASLPRAFGPTYGVSRDPASCDSGGLFDCALSGRDPARGGANADSSSANDLPGHARPVGSRCSLPRRPARWSRWPGNVLCVCCRTDRVAWSCERHLEEKSTGNCEVHLCVDLNF